ncbi:MAG: cell division protein FtsZ [Ruminococcaceae bacterium]|nr:cell division protein FtsZ [Oscillospiraceae bacterium]
MTFEHDTAANEYGVNIKVIGVGGGGNNAINRMIASGVKGVDFIAINTDKQALKKCVAPTQLVIGEKITNGFGAGSNPEIGERAAEEAVNEIKKLLSGADMVFITAGMGGGTGTGAAPVVARLAQELEILTVGVVTTPFGFEGKRKMERAEEGISEISQYVDSLVVIPNDRLRLVTDTRITLLNAFSEADEVLRRAVQSISDLINIPGFINIDFADVTSIIANSGVAYMGMGSATGKDKAQIAANMAIASPLLETSIKGAKGVIISIFASADVGLEDVEQASSMISESCSPDASVIWGVAFDPDLEDEMRITIVAAGFDKEEEAVEEAPVVEQPAEEEVVAEEPKKNGDLLDDFFGNM